MGGPGCQPGMARRADAGPMEAGSMVVATINVTIALPHLKKSGIFLMKNVFFDDILL